MLLPGGSYSGPGAVDKEPPPEAQAFSVSPGVLRDWAVKCARMPRCKPSGPRAGWPCPLLMWLPWPIAMASLCSEGRSLAGSGLTRAYTAFDGWAYTQGRAHGPHLGHSQRPQLHTHTHTHTHTCTPRHACTHVHTYAHICTRAHTKDDAQVQTTRQTGESRRSYTSRRESKTFKEKCLVLREMCSEG